MKKLFFYFFTAISVCAFFSGEAKGTTGARKTEVPMDSAAAQARLSAKLDEIGEAAKSSLSHDSRKALRREAREIKQEIQSNNGGIYISLGALIIIILLIIILL